MTDGSASPVRPQESSPSDDQANLVDQVNVNVSVGVVVVPRGA